MYPDSNIEYLEPAQLQQANEKLHEGVVNLPSTGFEINENSRNEQFVATFKHKFLLVSQVQVFLEFEDNLWEKDESYMIHWFGGQKNRDKIPRDSATLIQRSCPILQQFCTGSFNFNISTLKGSMHLKSIRFELKGHKY